MRNKDVLSTKAQWNHNLSLQTIHYIPCCQYVFDGLTWGNGYGSYAGGTPRYEIGFGSGGGESGNENGNSVCVSFDGNGTCGETLHY